MATKAYDLKFDADRVSDLLERLERLIGHDPDAKLAISSAHDELDAIAFGINALADELRWAHARSTEAERARDTTAFHSNPCAMAIVRMSDARFQDVNTSFERQTGFRRHDVLGRTVDELGLAVDPADRDTVVAVIRRGERLESHEVRFRTRSGAIATLVCSAEVIQLGGEACILAAGLDVTKRKRSQTQAALLREELAHLDRVTMLDALTASLAQQINQPLTAVATNADAALLLLAADPPRWGDVASALTDIRRDSHRAGEVVHRLRGLLKKHPAQQQHVDLGATVAEVVKLAENNAAVRRIGLDVDLPAAGPMMLGDRIQIQQVVLNLLLNAFDAVEDLPPPERRVRLDVSRRDGRAVFEVSDGGSAVPVEQTTRLFEPFYTTKQEGLALGLPICRAIVAAHDGTIEVRRNAGTGMTFSVAFPILTPREPADADVADTPRLPQHE